MLTLYKGKVKATGALRVIIKLLLNSLYGRFGMRQPDTISSVVPSSEADFLALTHGVDLDIELWGGENHFVSHKKSPNTF